MQEGKKILLVDDDAEFVQSNRDLLEAHGYQVFTASDGAGAIDSAARNKPDLVILDVMMTSDTEGFEVSREMAETPALKNIPVVLLTGIRKAMKLPFGFEPDADWLPVKTVLEKPVRAQTLLDEIKKRLSA
jgi:two-component system, OmpR family, alkaline phosphatase synthesis response regulator PhoP